MNELDLFAAAIGISNQTERNAFLDRECNGRADLRQRLAQLLNQHDRSHHLLDRLNEIGRDDQTGLYQNSSPVGSVIAGRYKLLEQIGEGGMGAVWVAEQSEPVRRKVAIKLIKAGMDSRAVLARFEAERQALAIMDHPNIAKVLDGGLTDEGRPYFVMEYVKGVPITEYCDSLRLSVAERLNLFIQVCSAVQHAHQKGIIHRDLKPSNILVAPYDDKPVPKVIDFGLAKALHQRLTERTIHTAHETVIGTPLYMSPEQAQLNNLDVDTRSDIYSLGVLLYELLTGTTPLEKARFKEAAWDEVRRIIREEEPQRPSTRLSSTGTLPTLAAARQTEPLTLTKQLRGELDWIVMKALEKERTRRYETANGLAKDVQRYLSGDTVEACPPTLGYRLRKVYRRNRAAILTVAAFLLVLVCGLAATSYGLIRANSERQRAEGAERDVLDITQQAQVAAISLEQVKTNVQRERVHLGQLKYARALHFADTALQTNKFDVARKELDQARPEQRGWEWHYLKRQWRSDYVLELKPSHKEVNSMDYSLDGRWIVSAASTLSEKKWIGSVQLWNASTGELHFTLVENLHDLRTAAFSHDGQAILVVQDKMVVLWNVTTRAVVWQIDPEPGMSFMSAELSPDGNRLIVNYRAVNDNSTDWYLKRSITVWDIASRKSLWPARRWDNHAISSPSFSHDGQWILFAVSSRIKTPTDSTSRGGAQYWEHTDVHILDAATGKTVFHLPTPTHSGTRLYTIRLNSSADRLITCDFEGRALLWPVKKTGDTLVRQGDPVSLAGHASYAIFSPDGKQLVATGGNFWDRSIRVWDVARGVEIRELKGHSGDPWHLAYSPDGTQIAAGSNDGTVKIWEAQKKNEPLFSHEKILHAQYSPQGDLLLTSSDTNTKVWSTKTGKELCPPLKSRCQWHNCHPAFSPDGRWLAIIDDKTILIHDTLTFAVKHTLTEPAGEVKMASFNDDGTQLLVASNNWAVKVWDTARGVVMDQISPSSTQRGYVNAAYSPDGKQFFVERLGKDAFTMKGITLYDARTRQPLQQLEMDTMSYDHWNGAISADGKRFVAYFQFKDKSHECRVWNIATGKQESRFTTHPGTSCHMAVSNNGDRLITICDQTSVQVWDINTGLELLNIPTRYNVHSIALHPDGSRIALAHVRQDVLILDGTPLPELKP